MYPVFGQDTDELRAENAQNILHAIVFTHIHKFQIYVI